MTTDIMTTKLEERDCSLVRKYLGTSFNFLRNIVLYNIHAISTQIITLEIDECSQEKIPV